MTKKQTQNSLTFNSSHKLAKFVSMHKSRTRHNRECTKLGTLAHSRHIRRRASTLASDFSRGTFYTLSECNVARAPGCQAGSSKGGTISALLGIQKGGGSAGSSKFYHSSFIVPTIYRRHTSIPGVLHVAFTLGPSQALITAVESLVF